MTWVRGGVSQVGTPDGWLGGQGRKSCPPGACRLLIPPSCLLVRGCRQPAPCVCVSAWLAVPPTNLPLLDSTCAQSLPSQPGKQHTHQRLSAEINGPFCVSLDHSLSIASVNTGSLLTIIGEREKCSLGPPQCRHSAVSPSWRHQNPIPSAAGSRG